MENLDEYRKLLRFFAEKGSNRMFPNDSKNHASVVLETIYDFSKEKVRIYTDKMSGSFSSDEKAIKALYNFLSKQNTSVEILVEDDSLVKNKNSDFYKKIINFDENKKNRIITKKSNQNFKNSLKSFSKNGEIFYFTLGDKSMYRLQAIDKNEQQEKLYSAFVCFNDTISVSKISEIFDTHFYTLPTIQVFN